MNYPDQQQKTTDRERGISDQREQDRARFTDHCAMERGLEVAGEVAPNFARFATELVKAHAKELVRPTLETFTIQVWEMKDGRKHPTGYIVQAHDLDEAEWLALEKHRLLFQPPQNHAIWTDRGGVK